MKTTRLTQLEARHRATAKAKKKKALDVSEPEKARADAVFVRAQARAKGPRLKLELTDSLQVSFDHPDIKTGYLLTMADVGTCDIDFADGVIKQIAAIGSPGNKVDEGNSNFVLSVVRAVQPKDEEEALLAVQMGAVHSATMMMARRLNHVENIPQQDAAERALNKLARTYTVQMEALRKHRNGGKQTVTVQHVKVEEGGQAIVGNVEAGRGGTMESDANPMRLVQKMNNSPRCTANSKRTGKRCKGPAVRG